MMGLESVELVMEFEDEFGIQIPDADAEQLRTIGGVVRYIAMRKGLPTPSFPPFSPKLQCSCLRAFHAVRRVLVEEFQVPRRAVHPRQRVLALVSTPQQPALEQRMISLGVSLRPIRMSVPDSLFHGLLMLGAAAVGLISLWVILIFNLASVGAGVALVAVVATLAMVALVLRRRTHPGGLTIGDIVRQLASSIEHEEQDSFADDTELAARNESARRDDTPEFQDIRVRVCAIVSGQLGVDRRSLSDATSFVRDLGI